MTVKFYESNTGGSGSGDGSYFGRFIEKKSFSSEQEFDMYYYMNYIAEHKDVIAEDIDHPGWPI